jgi:hypothetical protein
MQDDASPGYAYAMASKSVYLIPEFIIALFAVSWSFSKLHSHI